MESLKAGAAATEISPKDSQYLTGYYHALDRYSTGIHDPLLSCALYLSNGQNRVMFISNDIINLTKEISQRTRKRISEETGIPVSNIMITASHTHSGPLTYDNIKYEHDPNYPKADPAYIRLFEQGIVSAGLTAYRNAQAAQAGLAVADGTGVGSNRRDPCGPSDPEAPVLMVKTADCKVNIACMMIYSMHPTVLHKDSTLVTADFPGMTRQFLQQTILGEDCPVLYHTGPSGNQSPRYVAEQKTFAEAKRLGEMLGRATARVIPRITYTSSLSLESYQHFIDLPRKQLPTVAQAQALLERAREKLDSCQRTNQPRAITRTAYSDWTGTENALQLARLNEQGRLTAYYESLLPAEIQILKVGPWSFVGWPADPFVEYALSVKDRYGDTFIISHVNTPLGGYIVTEEAARQGGYEAFSGVSGPDAGKMLVDTTLHVLEPVSVRRA